MTFFTLIIATQQLVYRARRFVLNNSFGKARLLFSVPHCSVKAESGATGVGWRPVIKIFRLAVFGYSALYLLISFLVVTKLKNCMVSSSSNFLNKFANLKLFAEDLILGLIL